MREVMEKHGNTPVLVQYLHLPPLPKPRPMNSAYLNKKGYNTQPGNVYVKDEVSIHYDGASWWVFYFCASFRIETIEEFEKLILI